MKRYKVTRFYESGLPRRTIRTGLTLEEAQAHCRDPETSSSTCCIPEGHERRPDGQRWFDGYTEE